MTSPDEVLGSGESGTTRSVVAEHFRAVERTWKRSMCWVVIDQRNRTIAGDMSERTARRVARLFNEDDARGVQSWCLGCNGEGITDCVACDECQGRGKRVVIDPPADLVMVVDRSNTAHVLLPADERPVFRPTLCGSEMYDLAAIHDLLDTLAAPWSLLTDRQYRAWPPWPCQTCVGRHSGSNGEQSDG